MYTLQLNSHLNAAVIPETYSVYVLSEAKIEAESRFVWFVLLLWHSGLRLAE